MKRIVVLILILLVLTGLYFYVSKKDVRQDGQRVGDLPPTDTTGMPTAEFSGKLEEVNTACFADGECYVVVDGKHVTTTIGWSREIVGTIQGVEGFGDLESHIGEEVEVYALEKPDGTYTLYGSETFYVKLK